METSLPRLLEPIMFRFFADFNIQIQPKKKVGLSVIPTSIWQGVTRHLAQLAQR
jgi:hypothetical protein